MKKCVKIFTLFSIYIFLFIGCAKKTTTPIDPHYQVPENIKEYFVNYDVGTCWVYKDTLQKDRYDTIELVDNHPITYGADGGIWEDGFFLEFKPKKTKGFWMTVMEMKNNQCNIDIYPENPNASGDFYFRKQDSVWITGVVFYDSLRVGIKTYHNVLSPRDGGSSNFSNFIFSQKIGLVAYQSQGLPGVPGGSYVFVKTFKK